MHPTPDEVTRPLFFSLTGQDGFFMDHTHKNCLFVIYYGLKKKAHCYFEWVTHVLGRIKMRADAPIPPDTMNDAAPAGRPRGGFNE